jgi:hypothetical protein
LRVRRASNADHDSVNDDLKTGETVFFGFTDANMWAGAAVSAEVPLAELGGAGYPFAEGVRDRHLDYDPSLAPIASGGYTWVAFISRRTHGNLLVKPCFRSERRRDEADLGRGHRSEPDARRGPEPPGPDCKGSPQAHGRYAGHGDAG